MDVADMWGVFMASQVISMLFDKTQMMTLLFYSTLQFTNCFQCLNNIIRSAKNFCSKSSRR
jgi:hypothetical protein